VTDDHTLLVASTGGHLTQLIALAPRITDLGRTTWVTFESPQSRSLLSDQDVEFVPYLGPRGYRSLMNNLPRAVRVLRRRRPTRVVSTGAGIALAYLPLARWVGASAHYIESASRVDGPSRTGELLQRAKRVGLHTQHHQCADDRWTYVGSVFDGFEPADDQDTGIDRVVVALGTMEIYGFRRLVERLVEVLPAHCDVIWQVGCTDVSDLDIEARETVPATELHAALAKADLVVAHAGTGTALSCLEVGQKPLLVPRSARHGEHVDDHQHQTARYLAERGLATVAAVETLDRDSLMAAVAGRVRIVADPAPILL
jgi:UDP-N-acetylglucosamine--N-acetylmuramyl-(pentapeptide) pyrophosphoryl-undecaprenol N-acetylglucosamine transferase